MPRILRCPSFKFCRYISSFPEIPKGQGGHKDSQIEARKDLQGFLYDVFENNGQIVFTDF